MTAKYFKRVFKTQKESPLDGDFTIQFSLICHGIGEYYVVPVRISFAGALWYSSPLGFTLQEAFDVMKFFHTGGKYSSSFLLWPNSYSKDCFTISIDIQTWRAGPGLGLVWDISEIWNFPSRSVVKVLMSSSLSVRFGDFHFLLTFVCSLSSFPVGSGVDTLFVCPSLGHLFVEPLLWCSFLDIDFLVSRLFFTAVGSTFVLKISELSKIHSDDVATIGSRSKSAHFIKIHSEDAAAIGSRSNSSHFIKVKY